MLCQLAPAKGAGWIPACAGMTAMRERARLSWKHNNSRDQRLPLYVNCRVNHSATSAGFSTPMPSISTVTS